MDVLSGMSDDQMAILMCVAAVMGCALVMSLSYYIGAERREDEELRILLDQQDQSEESHRKAA